MIIAIIGNVGSGKTLSAVRMMKKRNTKKLLNFSVNMDNSIRLEHKHIISEKTIRVKKTGEPVTEKTINWQFWNDMIKNGESFDIILDEVHNIVHSRLSMTKNNTLLTMWFSQIRKILGENEKNHIFLISQRISRIDKAFRDLIDTVIYCIKLEVPARLRTRIYHNKKYSYKNLPAVYVLQYIFKGENCLDKYMFFRQNPKMSKKLKLYSKNYFLGNPYFEYYDSYELVQFGESAYI